jgi:hypothetical protein
MSEKTPQTKTPQTKTPTPKGATRTEPPLLTRGQNPVPLVMPSPKKK